MAIRQYESPASTGVLARRYGRRLRRSTGDVQHPARLDQRRRGEPLAVGHRRTAVGLDDLPGERRDVVGRPGHPAGDRPHRIAALHRVRGPPPPASARARPMARDGRSASAGRPARSAPVGRTRRDGGTGSRAAGKCRRRRGHREEGDEPARQRPPDPPQPEHVAVPGRRHPMTQLEDHLADQRHDDDGEAQPADDQRDAQEGVDQLRRRVELIGQVMPPRAGAVERPVPRSVHAVQR